MKLLRTASHLALTSAILSGLAIAAPAAAQDAAPMADEAEDGGEIVVTARRREESLQDVPISVTAISGDQLEATGAADLTALQQKAPNMTMQIARGSNSTLIGFIRGVGQQDPLWGFEPGVGIYVDDVYIARPQGAVLDIFDVERIEVLRGPQGTLYGRNSVGGAVKYVTKKLGNEFGGKMKVAVGSYDQLDFVGQVTVPLSDTLSIGGAVARYTRDGYGTNLNTGAEHYNKDVIAGRLSVEFAPSDTLFVRIAGDYTRDESNARHGHREVGNGTNAAFAPPADIYDTNAGIGDDNLVETKGISGTIELGLNDALTLKSITAYREGKTDTLIDFDNTPGPVLDVPAFYRDDQFSQEVQLLVDAGKVQGVLGVYYLDSSASGAFDTVLGGFTILTSGSVKTQSLAVFGDVNFDLSEHLKISVGARYTSDKRTGTVFRQSYFGTRSPVFGNSAAVPFQLRTDYTNDRTDDQFTPRVSASWMPSDDATFYASYSKGFKAGGFDMRGDAMATPGTVNGYAPEKVDAYEVGFKGAFLDRTLFINAAAFYSDYSGQQITTQVPVGTPPNATIASFVDNVGDSKIKGVELEIRAIPSDNLSLNLAFGYTDAKFKRFITFDPVTQTNIDVSDQRGFQNTPEFTVSFAPVLSADVAGGKLALAPSVSLRSDSQQFEINNPLLDQDGYVLVDASVNWTSGDGRFNLGLHGRNLTDEAYKIGGYSFPGAGFGNSIIAFYGPPRTVTFTAGYNF